ncbi:MAG: molybdopterin-dependent oxidoreductase [Actinobacteria bacterium]|nr:molybdopterin-dependent oxidoreductase [Actinomycetota bacterium]
MKNFSYLVLALILLLSLGLLSGCQPQSVSETATGTASSSKAKVETSATEMPGSAESASTESSAEVKYDLIVSGNVEGTLKLTIDDLEKMKVISGNFEMIKANGEVVRGTFTGVSIDDLLSSAHVKNSTNIIIFYASDGYYSYLNLDEVVGKGFAIAYQMDGKDISIEDGGPLRLIAPGLPAANWVKYLSRIELTTELIPSQESEAKQLTPNEKFFTLSISGTPDIDMSTWKLSIEGEVEKPLALSYEDINNMPSISRVAVLECAGNPEGGSLIGTAVWTGLPLRDILNIAGLKENALEVAFHGADGFTSSIPIKLVYEKDVLIAYMMNGEILASEHGYPVRVVVPDHYGYKWVKWIEKIEVVDYDYRGYWETQGWSDAAVRGGPKYE